ncbi:hypothetical protein AB0F17_28895 [Nonomuraea sp. NPDC026600]|uniref:hypothetical protein n=1 Tax=Nonomuraea sp. NPDC026600 TaxID=3155363 RepID=UPI0033DB37DB
MRLLAIARTRTAAHDLAMTCIGERLGTDEAITYAREVTLHTPVAEPFDVALIKLPPGGLSAADVEWIETGVLTRLVPGANLAVRFG